MVATKILQNLPNGEKILQIYRMTRKYWGCRTPTPLAKSICGLDSAYNNLKSVLHLDQNILDEDFGMLFLE